MLRPWSASCRHTKKRRTNQPTNKPTDRPTNQPSNQPTNQPTNSQTYQSTANLTDGRTHGRTDRQTDRETPNQGTNNLWGRDLPGLQIAIICCDTSRHQGNIFLKPCVVIAGDLGQEIKPGILSLGRYKHLVSTVTHPQINTLWSK